MNPPIKLWTNPWTNPHERRSLGKLKKKLKTEIILV